MLDLDICSLYLLRCLSRNEMEVIADKLERKDNWVCMDPIIAETDRIVSPAEISSAGRYAFEITRGISARGSFIFSVSVPYDLMVNVELHCKADASTFLERLERLKALVLKEIGDVIYEGDIECFTIKTTSETLLTIKEQIETGIAPTFLEILYASDDLLVIGAGFPIDCIILVGLSEDLISESQSLLQNIYRIRGGARHINNLLIEHYRSHIQPIEQEIMSLEFTQFLHLDGQKLSYLKELRERLFEVQQSHLDILAEFSNLSEYEILYMSFSPDDPNVIAEASLPYQSAIIEIQSSYLIPVKLLKQQIDSRFSNLVSYISDVLSILYSETNLKLARVGNISSYIQAVIAVILFFIALYPFMPTIISFFSKLIR